MTDDLCDEIQQFLDEGGEPAEPTPEARLMAVAAQFAQAMQPHIEAIVEALHEIAEIVVRAFRAFAEAMQQWAGPFVIGLRRAHLRARLEQLRLPRWLTVWLVAWWPERWLPQFSLEGA